MNNRKIFALFPGQGSQKVSMGKALYDTYPLAKELFQVADETLGFSLSKLCFEGPVEQLTMTEYAQPAILTVSTIFYQIAQENGFPEPVVAAGHSLGEYSALVAAGALSFSTAVSLVNKRGKYMQTAVPAGKGKMIAVLGKEVDELETVLSTLNSGTEVAEIANINAPGQVVLSGSKEGIDSFVKALGKAKVIELPVSAPFHSSLMKYAEEQLSLDLAKVHIDKPLFPVFSNFSAKPLTDPDEIHQALVLQVCGKVRWVECIENGVREYAPTELMEFGEGTTLTGLLKRIAPDAVGKAINSVESFR